MTNEVRAEQLVSMQHARINAVFMNRQRCQCSRLGDDLLNLGHTFLDVLQISVLEGSVLTQCVEQFRLPAQLSAKIPTVGYARAVSVLKIGNLGFLQCHPCAHRKGDAEKSDDATDQPFDRLAHAFNGAAFVVTHGVIYQGRLRLLGGL